jgi:hypothetical protein
VCVLYRAGEWRKSVVLNGKPTYSKRRVYLFYKNNNFLGKKADKLFQKHSKKKNYFKKEEKMKKNKKRVLLLHASSK